jgi:integrase/recombinase XerD
MMERGSHMRVQEILTATKQKRYLLLDENGEVVIVATRYLKYLDSIGRARNTLRSYAHGLKLFFEYLSQQQLDYATVTLDDLGDFVLWLKNPSRSLKVLPVEPVAQARTNRSINHILTTVAGFYDYLWRQDDLASNLPEKTRTYLPAHARSFKSFLHHISRDRLVEKNLLKQKVPRRQRPPTLSKSQIEQLVGACDHPRDKLLLTLLYESSISIGEALALWIEDIDIGRCQLCVKDRGPLVNDAEIKTPASCRVIDVSRDLMNQVLDYLVLVHTEEVESNHLFVKLRGKRAGQPLEYAEVNDLFQRLKRKTGIDASAHLLRHSSLTALSKAGWKPEHLRVRAGHAHFQYTYQLYVHPDDDELRQEWERTQAHLQLHGASLGQEDACSQQH